MEIRKMQHIPGMKTLARVAKSKRRSAAPILQDILIDGNGSAYATDMELYVEVINPALKYKDDGLYYGKGIEKGFFFKSDYEVSDFPEWPQMVRDEKQGIHQVELFEKELAALKWVNQAASREDARYWLNGVFFKWQHSAVEGEAVATDGHRLHGFKCKIARTDKGPRINGGAIIHRAAINIILDLVAEVKAESITITFHGAHYMASIAGRETHAIVSGRPIDGTYPDYKDKIMTRRPHDVIKTMVFDPQEIKDIIPPLAALAKINGARYPGLHFAPGGTVGITAENRVNTGGKLNPQIAVSLKFDKEIGFNAEYLTALCPGVLEYTGPAEPIIVRDRRGLERFAALMPLRV